MDQDLGFDGLGRYGSGGALEVQRYRGECSFRLISSTPHLELS